MRYLLLLILMPFTATAAEWNTTQREIIAAIQALSAATAPDGKGADEYATVLAKDFTRWTLGADSVSGRESWVEGMREWFDDGWRVTDRKQTYLEIAPKGDFATVRRIVSETYLGPDGEVITSKAAVAETWIREDGNWKLLRANLSVMNDEA
ncbi:MAG: nuclear transport factor 2 family protein [Gammaproteobacteria bacterium]|nr:nuclear transport factor 2 family protein [Gammaproteobacteria bacterium]